MSNYFTYNHGGRNLKIVGWVDSIKKDMECLGRARLSKHVKKDFSSNYLSLLRIFLSSTVVVHFLIGIIGG